MVKKKTSPDTIIDAVIYARYSSSAQKEESIEQQVAECEEYADRNNYNIVAIYSDKALTGKTDRRPEFQKMIRHAEKKQFQAVIAYKSNRIARNMLQAMSYEDKLSKWGVKVVYAKEEFGDTAAGRFALRTMMNVNQFYSENLSEDVKRGMLDNAEKCLITNGKLPLGYIKGEDGRYAIDEPNAMIVREIFSRFVHGEPYIHIARDLNARGLRTSMGREWGRSGFHSILNNERYTGVYIYDEVRIEGGVPEIISKEIFYRVQEILQGKKPIQGRRRMNGDYILTGRLFCGKCETPMVGVSGTGRSQQLHQYYICQKRRTDKTCDKKNVRKDWIEEQVAAGIKNYLLSEGIMDWIADSVCEYSRKRKANPDLLLLEQQLKDTTKAIDNIISAIEAGVWSDKTKDRLLELEADELKLKKKIAIEKEDIPKVNKKDIMAWLESFRNGKVEDKKYQAKIIDAFLISAYLYDDEIDLVFNFTGSKIKIRSKFNKDHIAKVKASCEDSFKSISGIPEKLVLS